MLRTVLRSENQDEVYQLETGHCHVTRESLGVSVEASCIPLGTCKILRQLERSHGSWFVS